jgi:hypothetical protein
MFKELSLPRLMPSKEEQVKKIMGTSDKEFSRIFNSFVEFDISKSLLTDTARRLENGEKIGVVTTHQSFIGVEVERQICEELNKVLSKPIKFYKTYSLPAVERTVKELFKYREEAYKDCSLNMIGVIRDKDRSNSDYSKNITPKMEKQASKDSTILMKALTGDEGCLFFIPFESTLESGRINPETGEINGIQKVSPNASLLGRMIKKRDKYNATFLPCGINGDNRIIDPDDDFLSEEFVLAFFNGRVSNRKLVTVKAHELIDPRTEYRSGQSNEEIFWNITTRVAEKVPPEARGVYADLIT